MSARQKKKKPVTKAAGPRPQISELNEAMRQQQAENAATGERLRGLLNREIEPPNEYVAYIVQKARAAKDQWEKIQAKINETTVLLKRLNDQSLIIQGQHDTYLDDLREWDVRTQEKGQKDA